MDRDTIFLVSLTGEDDYLFPVENAIFANLSKDNTFKMDMSYPDLKIFSSFAKKEIPFKNNYTLSPLGKFFYKYLEFSSDIDAKYFADTAIEYCKNHFLLVDLIKEAHINIIHELFFFIGLFTDFDYEKLIYKLHTDGERIKAAMIYNIIKVFEKESLI